MSVMNHHGIPKMVDVYIESSWIIGSKPESSPSWTEWSMQYHAMSCHAMPCHALLSVILVSISPQHVLCLVLMSILRHSKKSSFYYHSLQHGLCLVQQRGLAMWAERHHGAGLKEGKPLPSKWVSKPPKSTHCSSKVPKSTSITGPDSKNWILCQASEEVLTICNPTRTKIPKSTQNTQKYPKVLLGYL